MRVLDRLLTVVVTATLTSAAWIVFGGSLMQQAPLALRMTASEPTGPVSSPPKSGKIASFPKSETAQPVRVDTTPIGEIAIPVRGVRGRDLSDTFGDPRGGGTRPHEALDIMAAEGTPVVAAASGTVEKVFLSHTGGNTLYVRSPDGNVIYYYAHLRDYAQGLVEGQKVTRGQPLGTVGHTGNANPDGPHLHFAIMRTSRAAKWYQPSVPINPYPLLAGK